MLYFKFQNEIVAINEENNKLQTLNNEFSNEVERYKCERKSNSDEKSTIKVSHF